MATKVNPRTLITAGVTALFLMASLPSISSERQDLRLYRVNKDGLSDRFWFTRGAARKPGCHNLRKKSRLHSAVQFGYEVCRIYTAKNCAPDSLLTFTSKEQSTPSSELSQGYRWYTVSDHKKGERVKSWSCEARQTPINATSNTDSRQ